MRFHNFHTRKSCFTQKIDLKYVFNFKATFFKPIYFSYFNKLQSHFFFNFKLIKKTFDFFFLIRFDFLRIYYKNRLFRFIAISIFTEVNFEEKINKLNNPLTFLNIFKPSFKFFVHFSILQRYIPQLFNYSFLKKNFLNFKKLFKLIYFDCDLNSINFDLKLFIKLVSSIIVPCFL